jgi:uncharacterized protein
MNDKIKFFFNENLFFYQKKEYITKLFNKEKEMSEELFQNATKQKIEIKDTTANPAPLGLLAFGMTTVLLNIHNAGFYPLNAMILAMGIFYGGSAQVIAGVMEWKKNNTFGTTAFTSYGFFWLSFAALIILPKIGWASAPDSNSMTAYLAMWGIFTTIMYFGTLKATKALQMVFATLALLFFLLAIATATSIEIIHTIAGYEGIFCGLTAIYTGLAQVLNEVHGRTVWPLG